MTLDEIDDILRNKGYPARADLKKFPLGDLLLQLDSCAWTAGGRAVELFDRENPNSRDLGRDEQDLPIGELEERLREQERILCNEKIMEVYRHHIIYVIKAALQLTTDGYYRILERYDIWSLEPFASYGQFLQSRNPGCLLGPPEGFHRKFLRFAALYHDIGKVVHRDRHGMLGRQLLESLSDDETRELRDLLRYEGKDTFPQLVELVGHHDLFGMLCTGEASRPVLLDAMRLTDPERVLGSLVTMNIADIYSTLKTRNVRMDLRIFQTVLDDWKFMIDRIAEEKSRAPLSFQTGIEKLLFQHVQQRDYAAERIRRMLVSAIFMITEIRGMWGTEADQRAVEDAVNRISEKLHGRREPVTAQELRWLAAKAARNPGRAKVEHSLKLLEKEQYAGREITDAVAEVRRECAVTQEELKIWAKKITTDLVLDALRKRLGPRLVDFCDCFALVCKFNYTLRFIQTLVQAWIDHRVALLRLRNQIVEPRQVFEAVDVGDLAALAVEIFARLVETYEDLTIQKGLRQRRIGIELLGVTRSVEISRRIIGLMLNGQTEKALSWITGEAAAWYFV